RLLSSCFLFIYRRSEVPSLTATDDLPPCHNRIWGYCGAIIKSSSKEHRKMGEMKSIETLSGNESFPAYVAAPDGTAKAAILVIQEIFGVNKGIKAKCDAWA